MMTYSDFTTFVQGKISFNCHFYTQYFILAQFSRWIESVEKNPDTYNQQNAFLDSYHFRAVVKRVSKKLGFEEDLSHDDIFLIYDICRFEKVMSDIILKNVSFLLCCFFTRV